MVWRRYATCILSNVEHQQGVKQIKLFSQTYQKLWDFKNIPVKNDQWYIMADFKF